MHFSALTTLSLFMGASLATVISVPQDITERDIIKRAIAAGPHPHGECGSKAGHACHGSQFGLCCSKDGECGSNDKHCGGGCQGSYGHCSGHGGKPGGHPGGKPGGKPGGPHIIVPLPGKTTYGPVVPTSLAYALSSNGRCGVNYRFFCNGSRWGNCCSEDNYCGSTDSFCGTGCQDDFGDCSAVGPIGASSTPAVSSSTIASSSSSTVSSSATPSSTALPISRDGTCGKTRGFTCQGSTFGACCGADGFCGLGAACGVGCQSDAGLCAVLPSSSAAVSSSASAVSASSASAASVSSASSASAASASSASAASASSASSSSAMVSASPTPSSNGTMIFVKRAIEKRAEVPVARKLAYAI